LLLYPIEALQKAVRPDTDPQSRRSKGQIGDEKVALSLRKPRSKGCVSGLHCGGAGGDRRGS
jgi:hypothetical protein